MTSCDVLIVGGGPAGLSAGLWLARYLHRVVLIDSGEPRNWETRGIHGVLGQHGIRSPELRAKGREECRQFGVTLLDDTVESLSRNGHDDFQAVTSGGETFHARRVLLAIGIKDVWPDVPGLERCYGETAHVCPDCDGYEARGKKIVVIGTGQKAAGMALALTTWSTEIIICTNGTPADLDQATLGKLDRLNIPVLEARIRDARVKHGNVYALDLGEDLQLDCERIFFAIAQYPSDDLGSQLGCTRDDIGRIMVDEHYHTSVQDVYAAGDIAHGCELASVAMAAGAIAAIAIHHSLIPEERRLD